MSEDVLKASRSANTGALDLSPLPSPQPTTLSGHSPWSGAEQFSEHRACPREPQEREPGK